MSRVIRFHHTGGPEVLQLDECPKEPPSPKEVTVQIKAFGVNRAECMLRSGAYIFNPVLPCRIGAEGTGTIEATGRDVQALKIGDTVAIIPFAIADANGYWQGVPGKHGCYGETTTVPASAVIRVPDNLSPITNAASWHQYLTAWGGLFYHAAVTPEDTVLITAASSSTGLAGIQLCKEIDAKVIAATRSEEKVDRLVAVGADHVVVTNSQDLGAEILEITGGQGATVIYDPVSGAVADTLIRAASPEARIICYGNLDPANISFPARVALTKRVNIKFYSWGDIARRSERLNKAHSYVYRCLEENTFQPIIDTVFHGLESSVDAHRRMESNQQFGKIVIEL